MIFNVIYSLFVLIDMEKIAQNLILMPATLYISKKRLLNIKQTTR